ncbi:hypothetical protein BGZ76_000106 [Entomortierella beljakovae]|nr:hypothetical protein BGZ76_000106 [Entomortierella beljakovae]
MTLTNQNAVKYWAPIAYTRLILYISGYVLRTTVRHIFGRTPKGQSLLAALSIQWLKLVMGIKVINIKQARTVMRLTCDFVHIKNGTYLQSSKDQWATKVQGNGFNGFWIPFKDQSSKKSTQAALKAKTSPSDIGAGCDVVILAIHGGGMVVGDALMFLTNYRAWMKEAQKQGVKIGVLSVEYSLSPETPFPGALNECVAAFKDLVENHGVDPRRIILAGDSAGGNLCLTTSLKIRDDFPELGVPAAQILFSPWVMCPLPLKDSPDDYIINFGGHLFFEAYTQNLTKHQTNHHCAPICAPTLAGSPRMLLFAGGAETLKPSIDRFVEKAIAEGVDVEFHTKDGMPHDYCLIPDISSHKILEEANQIIGKFILSVRDQYVGNSSI